MRGSIAVALMCVGFVVVGCGTETTVKTVAETVTVAAPEPATTDVETEEEASEPEPSTAAVGDALTLHGNSEGLEVRVTLLRVVDNVKSSNEFLQPEAGNRYVAFQLRLENLGSEVYDDSPSNGAAVVDTQDQEFKATFADAVEPALGSPTIRSGDRRVGWITFEVAKASKLRTFQFALDSGFAPEAGEWTLR